MARVFTIAPGVENLGALKTGGQGSVYKGRRKSEVFTAIKILPTPIHSESADDKNYIAFKNEVEKLQKVNEQAHPNVVKMVSWGITDSGNLPFIEMEYIEGPDLEELVKPPHEPIFTIKEAVKVAEQLAGALAHCHRQDVKHGDIKSNNVKFNRDTGNYILLDFGLAMMSDEQRRTSLRHAGAIEFMAPEQNEGQMLFETDVYSFGVVLFELLTGEVPFPLGEKGESARNQVMLAHMEQPPPDIQELRYKNLPQHWSHQKKQTEMQLPRWLTDLVYKCLQKRPQQRFANGQLLYDFVATHSIGVVSEAGELTALQQLQQEVDELRRQNESLRRQLAGMHPQQSQTGGATSSENDAYVLPPPKKESSSVGVIMALLFTAAVIAAIYYFVQSSNNATTLQAPAETTASPVEKPVEKTIIGEYRVKAERAYFYNKPNENTRRNAYAVPSDNITVTAIEDGFAYTEVVNSRGQTSRGWLRLKDLVTLEEWQAQTTPEPAPNQPGEEEVSIKLNEARLLLNARQEAKAVDIYQQLANQNIPEARYQYANLALLGRHTRDDCPTAFEQMLTLAQEGYVPAKRTIGFLFANAGDEEKLARNGYGSCNYVKDVNRGGRFLMEASVAGDTTARRWLEELNSRNQPQ